MQDLESLNPLESEKPLMFFNYLIKDFFKNLKYLEHGKTKKFHVLFNSSLGYIKKISYP